MVYKNGLKYCKNKYILFINVAMNDCSKTEGYVVYIGIGLN